ncbi:ATP-grasp domain-containing protein [Saccharothrix syringae]|uniref:ATP-grasp domain-containing protein n=1 Tax=Saccharothrix syringae TaxID=103733 RepID=A0A5Q0H2N5_SACSY|nr:ATP-grasp domain-containing protein [Saccharothrix syringae]QFZ20478.1 ATP-grasp domain-containing protein [Saccharothrix syringae]
MTATTATTGGTSIAAPAAAGASRPGTAASRAAGVARVLVTGVGGVPGFDLARGVLARGHQVVVVDAEPLAVGLALPGTTARVVVRADDPRYPEALLALCRELRPDAILSTVEAELVHLVALREALTGLGVRTWLPGCDTVLACVDKARFHQVMTGHGVPGPATWLPEDLHLIPGPMPLVVKPRRGQGARGVHFCADPLQAATLCELVEDPIVQQRVTGREFTADCLVDDDATASVVLRYRLLVKGGLSMVSRTFADPAVTDTVRRALTALGMVGACCAQGFVTDDDRVLITEVNARVAGGFPLAEAAGADLVGQLLAGLFGRPVDHDRMAYTPGRTLTKYIETLSTADRGLS